MRIVAFSVQNYRSITKAEKLPISNSTILIGPNNEGKSNILRALVATLQLLKWLGRNSHFGQKFLLSTTMRRRFSNIYEWDKDYPITLQPDNNGESICRLGLELTPEEIEEFRKKVGSDLNGTLPIEIKFGKKLFNFKVAKRGRGGKALSDKKDQIAEFISGKIDFVYIPAVRTASSAKKVVENILSNELQIVEEDQEFKKALAEIAKIQQPVLDRISESIKGTLKEFLPKVKDVKVEILEEDRYQALRRSCKITINDGTPTRLEDKGDGVQSLAALSLMRYATEKDARGRYLVLAIEEPESHLHPRAIHQLKQVLKDISEKNQVILTTHCPVFVDRVHIRENIIVSENKAIAAKNIKMIREVLGVRAADNLQHAELILMVEGEDDVASIKPLLINFSNKLKTAFQQGTIAIDSLLGGTNLSYKLSQLRDVLCNYHCFLDDDDCGRQSFERAERDNLITQAENNFTVCNGMRESEMEDLYDDKLYSEMIRVGYGVSLECREFRSNDKWSNRMRNIFRINGKQWNDKVKQEIKFKISSLVAATPQLALNKNKRQSFDALMTTLENRLDELAYFKKSSIQRDLLGALV